MVVAAVDTVLFKERKYKRFEKNNTDRQYLENELGSLYFLFLGWSVHPFHQGLPGNGTPVVRLCAIRAKGDLAQGLVTDVPAVWFQAFDQRANQFAMGEILAVLLLLVAFAKLFKARL